MVTREAVVTRAYLQDVEGVEDVELELLREDQRVIKLTHPLKECCPTELEVRKII